MDRPSDQKREVEAGSVRRMPKKRRLRIDMWADDSDDSDADDSGFESTTFTTSTSSNVTHGEQRFALQTRGENRTHDTFDNIEKETFEESRYADSRYVPELSRAEVPPKKEQCSSDAISCQEKAASNRKIASASASASASAVAADSINGPFGSLPDKSKSDTSSQLEQQREPANSYEAEKSNLATNALSADARQVLSETILSWLLSPNSQIEASAMAEAVRATGLPEERILNAAKNARDMQLVIREKVGGNGKGESAQAAESSNWPVESLTNKRNPDACSQLQLQHQHAESYDAAKSRRATSALSADARQVLREAILSSLQSPNGQIEARLLVEAIRATGLSAVTIINAAKSARDRKLERRDNVISKRKGASVSVAEPRNGLVDSIPNKSTEDPLRQLLLQQQQPQEKATAKRTERVPSANAVQVLSEAVISCLNSPNGEIEARIMAETVRASGLPEETIMKQVKSRIERRKANALTEKLKPLAPQQRQEHQEPQTHQKEEDAVAIRARKGAMREQSRYSDQQLKKAAKKLCAQYRQSRQKDQPQHQHQQQKQDHKQERREYSQQSERLVGAVSSLPPNRPTALSNFAQVLQQCEFPANVEQPSRGYYCYVFSTMVPRLTVGANAGLFGLQLVEDNNGWTTIGGNQSANSLISIGDRILAVSANVMVTMKGGAPYPVDFSAVLAAIEASPPGYPMTLSLLRQSFLGRVSNIGPVLTSEEAQLRDGTEHESTPVLRLVEASDVVRMAAVSAATPEAVAPPVTALPVATLSPPTVPSAPAPPDIVVSASIDRATASNDDDDDLEEPLFVGIFGSV